MYTKNQSLSVISNWSQGCFLLDGSTYQYTRCLSYLVGCILTYMSCICLSCSNQQLIKCFIRSVWWRVEVNKSLPDMVRQTINVHIK